MRFNLLLSFMLLFLFLANTAYCQFDIRLLWDKNTETDMYRYDVYRSTSLNISESDWVDYVVHPDTVYRDQSACVDNNEYFYALKAENLNNLKSDFSSIVSWYFKYSWCQDGVVGLRANTNYPNNLRYKKVINLRNLFNTDEQVNVNTWSIYLDYNSTFIAVEPKTDFEAYEDATITIWPKQYRTVGYDTLRIKGFNYEEDLGVTGYGRTLGTQGLILIRITGGYAPPDNSSGSLTGELITDKPELKDFSMLAYPNPSNSKVMIKFTLPEQDFAEIKIHDILGQLIQKFDKKLYHSGEHFLRLNTNIYHSGMYLASIDMENYGKQNIKFTILK